MRLTVSVDLRGVSHIKRSQTVGVVSSGERFLHVFKPGLTARARRRRIRSLGRHFVALTGLTLTAVAHQWLFDPARVAASVLGKRVDHALVDDLERVAEARRRMDDAIGGGTLLPAVREDLRLVVAMLDNAAYTEDVGKRLHAVAAELGRLTGWLAYDSEQPALAQRYFLAAMRAAHVSGDRAIGANILGLLEQCRRWRR